MSEEERAALFRQHWPAIQEDYLLNGTPPATTIVQCAALYRAFPEPACYAIMMSAFDKWLKQYSTMELSDD